MSEIEGYVSLGFDAVLPKPFDQAGLKACLLQYCAAARAAVASTQLLEAPPTLATADTME